MPVTVDQARQRTLTPAAKRFFEALDALPPDKLYTATEIFLLCKLTSATLTRILRDFPLSEHYWTRIKHNSRMYYYGHPDAIRAYKEG